MTKSPKTKTPKKRLLQIKRATAAWKDARRTAGWTRRTFWLSPEARDALLRDAGARSISQQDAFELAMKLLSESQTPAPGADDEDEDEAPVRSAATR